MKSIIKDTSVIDNAKNSIFRDIVSTFQNFTEMLNNRVAEEVGNFKKIHDVTDKNTLNLEKSINTYFLIHNKQKEQIKENNEKIEDILKQLKNLNTKSETPFDEGNLKKLMDEKLQKELGFILELVQALTGVSKKDLFIKIKNNSSKIEFIHKRI